MSDNIFSKANEVKREDDGIMCSSDCLQCSSELEREEDEFSTGTEQITRMTSSLTMSEREHRTMQLAQSVCVKLQRIDEPSHQQRHLSGMQCIENCHRVEAQYGLAMHRNDGEACQRSNCSQDPHVQDKEGDESNQESCCRRQAEGEMSKQKKERSSKLRVTPKPPTNAFQMEERIMGKTGPGHDTNQSEVDLKILEPQRTSPPRKKWVIGPCLQTLKSKVASFAEIVGSPVKHPTCHEVSSSTTNLGYQNSENGDDILNSTCKRNLSSFLSQTMDLNRHTSAVSENVILPEHGGRQGKQTHEQEVLLAEVGEKKPVNHILHNLPFNAGLDIMVVCPDLPDPQASSSCPTQKCIEEDKETLEDCAIAMSMSSLSPIIPVDYNCNVIYPVPGESGDEIITTEIGNAELYLSAKPTEGIHPQHQPVDSSRSRLSKMGPHTRKYDEQRADVMLAKQSVCKTQMEMESGQEVRVEVKLRKGGNKKKELKKVQEEIARDLTIAETREMKQTASTKLLDKNSNDCLDSWQKVSRTGPNKAAQISHGHGYNPEIESSRDGCERLGRSLVKYPMQFVAETAPAMGGETTALVINNTALDLTNCNGYRRRKGNGKKSKVAITTNLNTRQTSRSKMLGGVSYEPNRGVNVSSGRMGKSVGDAEIESSAVLESNTASNISVPDSPITTDVLERKAKEGELDTHPDNLELTESPQHTVQSRGHPYCSGRKRKIELQSVGNSESFAVKEKTQQILHSELTQESQGNERNGKDIGRIGRVKWGRKTMSVKEAQKMGRHQNTDKVEKGDEGTPSYSELAPEQVSVHDGDHKQACEITASVKGEEEYDANAHFAVFSNTISRSPESLGLCQRDDTEPSNLLTRSDVVCNIQSDICSLDLMETATQESTQISCSFTKTKATQSNDISKESEGDSNLSSSSNVLRNSAITNTKAMSDPYAEHCGKSLKNVLVEDCKLEMMEGGSRDMPVELWKLNSSTEKDRVQKGRKHKQRSSRVAGTHKRKERQSQGARDDAIEIKEPQKKDNALKIKSSTAQTQPRLKRRHSCPEIAPVDSPWTGFMVPSSPLSRFPRSLVFHIPCSRLSSVKRARRHTVCSLEVEREIAPRCLRKEVYPIGQGGLYGSPSSVCPEFPSCISALASGFLASPQAFLSKKLQEGTGSVCKSGSSSHNLTSSSSCSVATPTPSSIATSSDNHSLLPATTSCAPSIYRASGSVSFCSVMEDESSLSQEDAEEDSCFSLDLDVQEQREEKSLSDSEIKIENGKQGEHWKVSRIKIRKTLPKPPTNLTPMGLPKPVRLKKKEFSLEEIYTNKNYRQPPEGRLETIFEVPVNSRDGSVSVIGQRKVKRLVEFPEVGIPRKPRRPLAGSGSGVSRKASESLNLSRTRRGGSDRAKEANALTAQEIESVLCSKLNQLDTWIALDEESVLV